jgi:selenocysteine lyase/cysteine desulfurase/tRNA(Ile)-lysidine synthase TilS/MesJ
MNLREYVAFYNSLKELSKVRAKFIELGLLDNFEPINANLIESVMAKFVQLFKINNFCYFNRWGSYDCILCRMTFLQESQYNDHEKTTTHLSNLDKCAILEEKIFNCNYKSFDELIDNYEDFEPIVYLSIYEHNSNALPWRETGARVIYINTTAGITLDYTELDSTLRTNKAKIVKMGSFTAASNITGIYLDADYLSLIMHRNNALVFFDYATASPYIQMNMNKPLSKEMRTKMGFNYVFTHDEDGLIYKDGLFFSPHKLLGGPNTPGVLIIKQHVVRNLLVPSEPGGGVVLFVRKERQNYVKNIEAREESGTPDIIGSVRIGLSLMLREKVDHMYILSKEEKMNSYIKDRLAKIPNLYVLGCTNAARIPIYSFVIKFAGRLLHYNFVSALLNDLFGIQSRGGCSCASTYGQQCLGLTEDHTEKLEQIVCNGSEIFRPGYTRVNFPYYYDQYIHDYILDAIEFVANYGHLFLPHYAFKIESSKYYHRNEDEEKRRWLNQIDFKEGEIIIPSLIKESVEISKDCLGKHMEHAYDILKNIHDITKKTIGKAKINHKILFADNEKYRWFIIPDDIEFIDTENENLISKLKNGKLQINFDLEKETKIEEELKEVSSKENTSVLITDNLPNITIETNKDVIDSNLFPEIPKKIIRLVSEASIEFDMLKDGDRILVGMSGGKDSMTLLHILLSIQKKLPFKIEIGGVTVDPQSNDYDPSPLIGYMAKLGVKYFFESDPILERAKKNLQNNSICAYCARMKRGIIYNCARREGYNVIALGQHLDDLAESLLMSAFHNGLLRTMKANYVIDQGDLKVIRPLIYCREKLFKEFVLKNNLPVIQENCPACFSAPKERHRVKVLLAQQENLFPNLFSSLQKAMKPLMKGVFEGEKKDDLDI